MPAADDFDDLRELALIGNTTAQAALTKIDELVAENARLRDLAGEEPEELGIEPPSDWSNITRDELVDLCTRALVPQDKWSNRDSAGAQIKIGTARQLLLAGCKWELETDPKPDANTIWIRIYYEGFNYHESCNPSIDDEADYLDDDLFYIPTAHRLAQRVGSDWY